MVMQMPEAAEPRTFVGEDFFRPGEHVYIQLSSDYAEYVGVPHRHAFIEIVYIKSGRATHLIEGQQFSVERGDISVINCMETHAFYADPACPEPFVAYDLIFTPDFLDSACLSGGDFLSLGDSFLFYSIISDDCRDRINLIKKGGFELGAIFDKIYEEYLGREEGCINLIRVYVAELIIKMFRKIQAGQLRDLSDAQKAIVDEVTDYICSNYHLNITMEDITSNVFFNKNYIARIFKEATGMPISSFLRQIRIKEAQRLLLQSTASVTDIARECGYNDMKNFYAAFRKVTGTTPGNYRSEKK